MKSYFKVYVVFTDGKTECAYARVDTYLEAVQFCMAYVPDVKTAKDFQYLEIKKVWGFGA